MQPDAEGSHRDSAGGRVTTDSLPCSLFVPPQRIDILPSSAADFRMSTCMKEVNATNLRMPINLELPPATDFGMPINLEEVNATNLGMPINMELPPATDFGMSTYMKEVNAIDLRMPINMEEVNAACFPM